MEEVHGAHDLVIGAVAAARVVGVLVALERDGEHDVAQTLDLVAERLVDEGRVGEDVEEAVVVLLGKAQDVLLAHQGLAAGHHVEVAAKLGALRDDLVALLVREVLPLLVVSRPAANAVLVARAGGVKDDDPGHVALVLVGVGRGVAQAAEGGLVAAVEHDGLEHVRVGLVDDAPEELLPLGAGIEASLQAARDARSGVLEQVACHVDELVEVLLAIITRGGLDDLVERDAERLALCRVSNL